MTAVARLGEAPAPDHERRWFVAGDWWLAIDVPVRESQDAPAVAAFRDALLLEEHAVTLDCLDRCLATGGDGRDVLDPDAGRDWRPATMPEGSDLSLRLTLVDRGGDAYPQPTTASSEGTDAESVALASESPSAGSGAGASADSGAGAGANEQAEPASSPRRVALAGPPGIDAPSVASVRAACERWHGRVLPLPHRLSTELVLDSAVLDDAELSRCAPGSLVLLPSSFGDAWAVTLRVPGADEASPARRLEPGTARLDRGDELADTRPIAESAGARCDIVLDERFEIPADAAGVPAEATYDLSLSLPPEALGATSEAALAALSSPAGRRCRLRRQDGPSAGGELVSLGAGVALVIDDVASWT